MSNVYYENLIQRVINASQTNEWHTAVMEWNISDCRVDYSQSSRCVCGKENLKYLFTIKNILNGATLYPIGSSCIQKFDRNDLNEQITVYEQMFKLLHAVEENKFITLDYFSRKLLAYLHDRGAFKPTSYNKFNGTNDYDFMVDMFNKRNKPTPNQEKKIRGIIFFSVIPFVKELIKVGV